MAFFRNILLSKKRVDIDMEAGNHSDVELNNMDADSRSAHAYSLNPDTPPLSMQTTVTNATFPLLPSAQIRSTILNIDRKRSPNDDRNSSKVRVVEQGSKMSMRVRLFSIKYENFSFMGFHRERLESDIRQPLSDQQLNTKRSQTND